MTVQTFTNCDSVALFVNGVSKGIKKLAKNVKPEVLWEVDYQPGNIRAIGYSAGKVVCENSLQTAGKPYRLVLESDRDTISNDGLDLAYITVKVVDKNGVVVPDGSHNIRFSVTGAGINAGVGNGDINSGELWQANRRSTFEGECQLIIRSATTSGTVEVKAASAGLKTAKLSLTTNTNN